MPASIPTNSPRRYFSDRKNALPLGDLELYERFEALYRYFECNDYLLEKTGSSPEREVNDDLRYKAVAAMGFNPYPIDGWEPSSVTADRLFDAIEFFYDHVSKPGKWGGLRDEESGWTSHGYASFDADAGQTEYRDRMNVVLVRYGAGFELTKDGEVRPLGEHGLQHILSAAIPHFDEENVDSKVREAVNKWRDRRLSMAKRREAIRDMADVFEWLKKTGKLQRVLAKGDQSDIFNIANNFAIRHHRPADKRNYDREIWYPWMFHFYLATYHALVRLLLKADTAGNVREA